MKKRGTLFAFLVGLGACLLFPTAHVRSQSFAEAVEVTKVDAGLLGNNLFFSGQVQNNLPWDIRNVKISVFRSTTIRITHERQLEMPTERSAAAATLSVH